MLKKDPIPQGKMVFVSKEPFEKDGQKFYRFKTLVTKTRQKKKEIMKEFGLKNGKQFRKWLREHR